MKSYLFIPHSMDKNNSIFYEIFTLQKNTWLKQYMCKELGFVICTKLKYGVSLNKYQQYSLYCFYHENSECIENVLNHKFSYQKCNN